MPRMANSNQEENTMINTYFLRSRGYKEIQQSNPGIKGKELYNITAQDIKGKFYQFTSSVKIDPGIYFSVKGKEKGEFGKVTTLADLRDLIADR